MAWFLDRWQWELFSTTWRGIICADWSQIGKIILSHQLHVTGCAGAYVRLATSTRVVYYELLGFRRFDAWLEMTPRLEISAQRISTALGRTESPIAGNVSECLPKSKKLVWRKTDRNFWRPIFYRRICFGKCHVFRYLVYCFDVLTNNYMNKWRACSS